MHLQYFHGLVVSAALISASPLVDRASAAAYCTNSDLSYKLSPIAAPVQGTGSPNGRSTWQLNVDDTTSGYKQTIDGFGACVTDATVTSFDTLSSGKKSSLLQELSHFSLLRHTIASSDLSGDPAYTYDDNGGKDDPSLSGFNLGDRGNAMAQMLKSMKSLNSKIKLLGSPWSPPGWMKLNKKLTGSTDRNNLNDGYLDNSGAGYSQAFANYFVKYIQAFRNLGVTVNAITVQNEPLNSQSGYPTMYMFDYEQAQLVQKYVGPALRSANTGTTVWAYDHNTGKLFARSWVEHVLTRL
jgi:glucosylceramidase